MLAKIEQFIIRHDTQSFFIFIRLVAHYGVISDQMVQKGDFWNILISLERNNVEMSALCKSIENNIYYRIVVLYFNMYRQESKSASNQIFSKFLSTWFSRTTHANWIHFFLIDSLVWSLLKNFKSLLLKCPEGVKPWNPLWTIIRIINRYLPMIYIIIY